MDIKILSFFNKKVLSILLIIFLFCTETKSQLWDGPRSPANESEEGSGGSWTSFGNSGVSDNIYTRSAQLTNNGSTTIRLRLTNFGISIPASSLITGIEVTIEKNYTGGLSSTEIRDFQIYLIKNGVTQTTTTNKAQFAKWPENPDAISTYGGTEDLWGNNLTAADVNSPNFGVAIAARRTTDPGGSAYANIDHVTITVFYTSILPARLLNFSAIANNENKVDIKWTTTEEENLRHFSIEHSENGIDYFPIFTTLPSNGSFSEKHHYKETHQSPKRNNYYRLKTVDIDGKFSYSGVKRVQLNLKENSINSFFINKQLHVSLLNAEGQYRVMVSNINGAILKEYSIHAKNENIHKTFQTDLKSNSIYIVTISNKDQSFSRKLFLNN
jgi:hypothetical protein